MILASSYIPSLDWYLVAQVPEAEIYAELDQSAPAHGADQPVIAVPWG